MQYLAESIAFELRNRFNGLEDKLTKTASHQDLLEEQRDEPLSAAELLNGSSAYGHVNMSCWALTEIATAV